jgi:hypothetical protein
MTPVQAAFSDPSPLAISVEAGFQGYYKIGCWLPLRVRIENNGPDLQVEIIAEVGGRRFSRSLALPSPAKKQIVLDVFSDHWPAAFTLTVMAAGTVVTTVNIPVTPLQARDVLMVSLGGDVSAPSERRGDQMAGQDIVLLHAATASLPERWKGYDMVTAVVLDPANTRPLIPAQIKALTHWLLLGGRLLLIRPHDIQTPAAPLAAHLLSLATPPVPQTSPDEAARYRIGLGQLATTPTAPDPMVGMEATTIRRSWTNWLDVAAQPDSRRLANRDRQILRGALPDTNDAKRRLGYLAAFFLIYVGVVVALFKCFASRHVRPWRHIAAVGVVVTAFTCLSVVLGYAVQWGAILIREATLVHVFPGSMDVFVTTAASLQSPSKQTYPLRTLSAAYVEVDQAIGGSLSAQMAPQHGLNETRVQLPMALWSARHLFVERFTSTPGFAVRSTGTVDELVNQSVFHLLHCHLFRHDRLYRLPDITVGRTFRLPRRNPELHETLDVWEQPALLKRVLIAWQSAGSSMAANGQVICVVEGSLPTLTGGVYRVRHESDTVLIFHL